MPFTISRSFPSPCHARPLLAAVSLCHTLLLAGPAAADRHCSPASEQYFMARQAALSKEPDADVLPHIDARLGAAGEQALYCGCAEIRAALDDLRKAVAEGPNGEVRRIVLDAEQPVAEAIEACH